MSGAAVCAAIFLYASRRAGGGSDSKRWQWFLVAVVGLGPAWSLLAPAWEATLVGFMSGFLACWILVLAGIAVSRNMRQEHDY